VILDVEHQFILLNINPDFNFKSNDLFNRFNLNENDDYVFGYGNYFFFYYYNYYCNLFDDRIEFCLKRDCH
jgi:hypothetical protein